MSARDFSGSGIRAKRIGSQNSPHAPGDRVESPGWKRGERGYAAADGKDQNMWDTDVRFNKINMDRDKLYGSREGDGKQGNFPGDDLTDTFKGSFGVDRYDRDQDGDDR